MSVTDTIREAITLGHNLGISYKKYLRAVTPHLLAETNDGRLVMQGFQFGGDSSKGRIPGPDFGEWRWFYLEDVAAANHYRGPAYPLTLAKTETEYKPPGFIKQILVMRKR